MLKLYVNTGCDLRRGIEALVLVTDKGACEGLGELKSFALEWDLTTPAYVGDGKWVCLPTPRTEAEFGGMALRELAERLFGDGSRQVNVVEAVPSGGSLLELE